MESWAGKNLERSARKYGYKLLWFSQRDGIWKYKEPETANEKRETKYLYGNFPRKFNKAWFITPSTDCIYYQRFNVPWTDTFTSHENVITTFKGNRVRKVGILVKDTNSNYFIMVQNYGNLWSIPKGSIDHKHANLFLEAMREFKEETGIDDVIVNSNTNYYIEGGTLIFLIEKDFETIELGSNLSKIDNEVTAIGKISLNCIKELIKNSMLERTSEQLFKRIYKI